MSLKILLVDDDITFLEVLSPLIEIDGHKVDTADNGLKALDLIEKEHYDLIISDLKMPISDGLTLLESIKDKDYPAKVIILTGFATVDKTIQAWRLGIYDFLTKPFKWVELKKLIQKVEKEIYPPNVGTNLEQGTDS